MSPMNIYVVKDDQGFLHIIHGNWLRAVEVSCDGDIRICQYDEINDIIYNRIPFENLKKYKSNT